MWYRAYVPLSFCANTCALLSAVQPGPGFPQAKVHLHAPKCSCCTFAKPQVHAALSGCQTDLKTCTQAQTRVLHKLVGLNMLRIGAKPSC